MNETKYSVKIEGTEANWKCPVSFEIESKTIAINQYDEIGEYLSDRVLLTFQQFDELVKFVKRNCKKKVKP